MMSMWLYDELNHGSRSPPFHLRQTCLHAVIAGPCLPGRNPNSLSLSRIKELSPMMSAKGPPPQGGPPPQSQAAQEQFIPVGPNGERPSPDQIRQIQQQLAQDAEKHGISVQEYVQRLRQQAQAQHQAQMQAQQRAQEQQQKQPIQPGPPKPEAIAVANWLKSQDLKPRTVVHDEKRKDMFRGTLQSLESMTR